MVNLNISFLPHPFDIIELFKCLQPSLNFFNKYLLSTYSGPGRILGTEDTASNKT